MAEQRQLCRRRQTVRDGHAPRAETTAGLGACKATIKPERALARVLATLHPFFSGCFEEKRPCLASRPKALPKLPGGSRRRPVRAHPCLQPLVPEEFTRYSCTGAGRNIPFYSGSFAVAPGRLSDASDLISLSAQGTATVPCQPCAYAVLQRHCRARATFHAKCCRTLSCIYARMPSCVYFILCNIVYFV